MKCTLTLAALLAIALAIGSPASAADKASAVLKDRDGKEVGKVELTDTPSGVLLRLVPRRRSARRSRLPRPRRRQMRAAGFQIGRSPFQS